MIRRWLTLLILLCLTLPGLVLAKDDIRFDTSVEVEVEKTNAQGEKAFVREPAVLVVPGTMVIYTNSFTNQTGEPAENLVLTNPIPEKMEYIAGSASDDNATVTFSADGGETFAAEDQLFISDSSGQRRLASPKEYTDIRWVLTSPLSPTETGSVEYRARLK